jgi:hypothetical protein
MFEAANTESWEEIYANLIIATRQHLNILLQRQLYNKVGNYSPLACQFSIIADLKLILFLGSSLTSSSLSLLSVSLLIKLTYSLPVFLCCSRAIFACRGTVSNELIRR